MLKKAVLALLVAGMILVAGCDYMQNYGFHTEITGVSQSGSTVRVDFTVRNTGYKDIIDFAVTMKLDIGGSTLYKDEFVGDLSAGGTYTDFATFNVGLQTYNEATGDSVTFSDYRFDIDDNNNTSPL
jgi:hypothetical protein